jgi:hypothetical protein
VCRIAPTVVTLATAAGMAASVRTDSETAADIKHAIERRG